MKPENTDMASRQAQRRKNAVWGAVASSVLRMLTAWACLWMRSGASAGGFVSKLLLIVIVLDLGSILPIWISLRTRLKEIEGGEEDAAAQY